MRGVSAVVAAATARALFTCAPVVVIASASRPAYLKFAAAEAQRAHVPLRGSLTLAVVADEEEGGTGTLRLVQSGMRATWAIVPEPTEPE